MCYSGLSHTLVSGILFSLHCFPYIVFLTLCDKSSHTIPTMLSRSHRLNSYLNSYLTLIIHLISAEYLEDFWQSSSLQGFPRVFTETVKFWKMFWFALFLLLVCGCIIQVYVRHSVQHNSILSIHCHTLKLQET